MTTLRFSMLISLGTAVACGGSADTPQDVAAEFVRAVNGEDCGQLFDLFHPRAQDHSGDELEDCTEDPAWEIVVQIADVVDAQLESAEPFEYGDANEIGEQVAFFDYDCPPDRCRFELVFDDERWWIVDLD